MGAKQSVELPPEPAAATSSEAAPPRPTNGGTLFKHQDGKWGVLTSAVIPELTDDNEGREDDQPKWILDVSVCF
jgi:hypothetical protein